MNSAAATIFYGRSFPAVVEAGEVEGSVETWIWKNAARLEAEAADCGVVLFRGFPLSTDRDFDAFVGAFEFPNFPYDQSLSNAVRVNRTERVFTANEAPSDVTIFLHHEMAQTPVYPSNSAAEQRLAALGYEWEWLEDDRLRATTPVLPAVRELRSGRKAFFNQLIAAFKGWKDTRNDPAKSITFGDGSPLDAGAASRATELAEELTVDLEWRTGDVALVDNFVAMHGRRPFLGTRKVLASLIA